MYSGVLLEFLNMGGGELALIMVAILLLFGGKKLPELARGLGKGIREFKDASEGVKREIHRNINAVDIEDELKDIESARTNSIEENAERHHPSEDDAPIQSLTPDENPVAEPELPIKKQTRKKKSKETEL
jgi:sec-independent protein translocase protein TatA